MSRINSPGVEDHSELTGTNSNNHHSRYDDTEASDAAPVQDVNGQTGSVSISDPNSTQTEAYRGDTTFQTNTYSGGSVYGTNTQTFSIDTSGTVGFDQTRVTGAADQYEYSIDSYVLYDDGTILAEASVNQSYTSGESFQIDILHPFTEPTDIEITWTTNSDGYEDSLSGTIYGFEPVLPKHEHQI